MADTAVCDWLMDSADAPIRYRVARELLQDAKTAKSLESELTDHPAAGQWLRLLKPQTPPRHRWMEHGSFDFCLENAILKAVQLGLHGGLPQLTDAAGHTLAKMERAAGLETARRDFITAVLTANLLSAARVEHGAVLRFMLKSLDEMHRFTQQQPYDFYMGADERGRLTGVPACWKNREHFIRPEIIREHGYAYPLLYDIVGMHSLYRLRDPATDRKIDDIIRYIAADGFHASVADGYGIIREDTGKYMAMGWDPKAPGWFGVAGYLASGHVPKLLFYALHASRYPAMRRTRWFRDLLRCLGAYQTGEGRYRFPAAWLPEKTGYAMLGSHLSFGETRRKKNWREIESTFYMQLLKSGPAMPFGDCG